MKIEETPLQDVYLVRPRVFEDARGYFFETFNRQKVKGTVLEGYNWVQENESQSAKGVLRGLHFQVGEFSQAKLVRVVLGEVFDVTVDLRRDSATFGKWFGSMLSSENKTQMLIPKGFAHGFLVLSDVATFSYKCDNYYEPGKESGIMYNDPDIGIEWPESKERLIISERDRNLGSFRSAYQF